MTFGVRVSRLLLQRRAVPILLGLYLLPRVAVLFVPLTPHSDASWYYYRALALASGYGYSEEGVSTAYWPPGWPLMMAGLFKSFGPSVTVAQYFNLVCAALSGWLTLDLGRRIFRSELAGRCALGLLAFYPNSIAYVPVLLTEVFFTTLLLSACWLLIARPATSGKFVAGLVLGIATLVKAQALLVIPFAAIVANLRKRAAIDVIPAAVKETVLVLGAALLVVMPWTIRNHQVFGEWVLVSTNGGLTLLTGNNPSARGDFSPDDELVTSIDRSGWPANQIEVDREARRRAIGWIVQNPTSFAKLIVLKVWRLWSRDGEGEWAYQAGYSEYPRHQAGIRALRYINQAYYTSMMVAFVCAGLLLTSGRVRISHAAVDWWALPYALAIYVTMIGAVFSGQSRFHYPVMPFVAMAAGWLLALCLQARPASSRPAMPA